MKPDFKTVADFRSHNCHSFRQVFRQFVLLRRELDLFGRQLLAVDGTRDGRDGETPLDRTEKRRHDGRDGDPGLYF